MLYENAVKCGISTERFWDLTYYETITEISGHQWRFDQKMTVIGSFAATIANAPFRKKFKESLYKTSKDKKAVSIKEHKKRFKKAIDLMGPDRIPVRRRRAT